MTNLIVITSFDEKKGLGHCYRQLSLCKKLLSKNIKIFFFTVKKIPNFLKNKNKKINFKILKNRENILKEVKKINPSWIFIDVHQSEINNYEYLSKIFKVVIFLSDIKKKYKRYGKIFFEYGKNILRKSLIFKKKQKLFISGRNFIWFRDEFLNLRVINIKKRKNDIFISHGGTDSKNLSLKNISMLENFHKKLSIYLVVTSKFKGLKKLTRFVKNQNIIILLLKISKNISKYMGNSKLAIINGGNTRYELCMTGTPILAISLTIQQILYNKPLTELKLVKILGYIMKLAKRRF